MIQKRKFGGNQGLRVRKPSQGSNGSSMLQEVGILPTLVYDTLRESVGAKFYPKRADLRCSQL